MIRDVVDRKVELGWSNDFRQDTVSDNSLGFCFRFKIYTIA